jgi:hypothetical protein
MVQVRATPTETRILAPGVVRLTPLGDGRYLAEIGRDRSVKRLQLSWTEAAQLHEAIAATVPGIAPAVTP